MEKLNVKNAIISRQGKDSSNFKRFTALVEEKNLNVIIVQAGDTIKIDEECFISILFPEKNLISTNILNNNSIVAKFEYTPKKTKSFSLLLTGDIEEIAEHRLVELYQDTNSLQATMLKVRTSWLKNIINRRIFAIN